ncbi:hypothetical protein CFE88_04115 [Staphylococcus epidermidis]|nr:hypothetical protein CFE88_04115 [Staphylococcus epidermidis]
MVTINLNHIDTFKTQLINENLKMLRNDWDHTLIGITFIKVVFPTNQNYQI